MEKLSPKLLKDANDFLAANPTVKKVFVTKDGQVFTNENFAMNHARSMGSANEVEIVGEEEVKTEEVIADAGGQKAEEVITDAGGQKAEEVIPQEPAEAVPVKPVIATEEAPAPDAQKAAETKHKKETK